MGLRSRQSATFVGEGGRADKSGVAEHLRWESVLVFGKVNSGSAGTLERSSPNSPPHPGPDETLGSH